MLGLVYGGAIAYFLKGSNSLAVKTVAEEVAKE